jgi:hypothetical protein
MGQWEEGANVMDAKQISHRGSAVELQYLWEHVVTWEAGTTVSKV